MDMRYMALLLGLSVVAGIFYAGPLLAQSGAGIVTSSARPIPRPALEAVRPLRWSHVRGSDNWTRAALSALRGQAQILPSIKPHDIEAWCPAYPRAKLRDREYFWAGLLSTLSKHESTYRPTAVGGGGRWYGLVQILPATARGYGCQAQTGEALLNPELNIRCAFRILSTTVPRDGVVSEGMRGVAADWGPFHQRRKREDMRAWMLEQPYCKARR